MKSLNLKQKIDVVIVTRRSRGKFPGKIAAPGTVGLVWSRWCSNFEHNAYKISILTSEGEILFTTEKCVEKVGDISMFENLYLAYKDYADKNYIPIVVKARQKYISDTNNICLEIKFMSKNKFVPAKYNVIHPEDRKIITKDLVEDFYYFRLEEWFLKKHEII